MCTCDSLEMFPDAIIRVSQVFSPAALPTHTNSSVDTWGGRQRGREKNERERGRGRAKGLRETGREILQLCIKNYLQLLV